MVVFIYFVTRSIYLELISDLSTQTFIAALTRFMSRRGICLHIHSDNDIIMGFQSLKELFTSVQICA